MIASLFRHLRDGTWPDALRFRMDKWLTPLIERRNQLHVRSHGIHRFDIRNRREAIHFLANQAAFWHTKKPGTVVLIGSADDSDVRTLTGMIEELAPVKIVNNDLNGLPDPESISCFICCSSLVRIQHECAERLNRSNSYRSIPFEYVARPSDELAAVKELTLYSSRDFVSPLLIDSIDYFSIYRESLSRFEMKCEIRDFMDLAQAVSHIVRRKVDGDVCEFGSFKGHSGYLIARLLEANGSLKQLHLFDMFEHFPDETAGVDSFWSGTHTVDFGQVSSALSVCRNVRLVKGDFTETFETAGIERISLAHIDCDSYRATKYLLEQIFDNRLSQNGMIVCEDYGHPTLMGNRLAVQEFFQGRTDCFTYFSQFSGCFIAVKQ